MPPQALSIVEGSLERITYYNPQNHYTIAKLKEDHTLKPVTVIGFMPNPTPGERTKITGTWETHPKYGQQLKIVTYETLLPATVESIRNYLSSGFIKGIGAKTVARIVGHFKEKTLTVIENSPEELAQVRGIGKETAARIATAWTSRQAMRQLMQFLQDHHIPSAYGAKILNAYGTEALTVLQTDPLRIAKELPRIGFRIADAILQRSGLAVEDPERIKACVQHLLYDFSEDGHTYMPAPELIRRCTEQFGVEEDSVSQGVEGLIGQGEIIAVTRRYGGEVLQALYLPGYYQAETGIADKLHILKTRRAHPIGLDAAEIDRTIMRHLALKLSQNQLAVLVSVLSHRVAVITGGPGTGKTTLIRSLAALLQQAGKRVLLAAPTGRAARRLTAVTRAAAMTIHKLLGYNPSRQQYEQNRDNPLDADFIIVDEASMVDTTLMYHLVDAIHITSRLIMVGDVFQLPSVGPGNVLSDLIRSNSIQTFELTKIFRQAAQSAIVVNAHKIRQGQMPTITTDSADPPEPGQFWFIEQHRPESVVDTVMALCTRHMAERFDYDPVTDVQVLAPMHKGVAGAVNLNNVLQQRLNPNPVAASIIGRPYKLNDKVMHLKNNYAKEVFNGDIGYIATIDPQRERVSINYEHKVVEYDYGEMDEVALAYAISVHKSQGSEYPAVILPLLTQHYAMLYRSLVYTAVSRAKSMVIIVGSTKALALAVQNDRPRKRFSGLAECIAAH